MEKHQKKILKFLTQNPPQGPTITDMMSQLKLQPGEIGASLDTLLAQGLVAKKMNPDGMICWYPAFEGKPMGMSAAENGQGSFESQDNTAVATLTAPEPEAEKTYLDREPATHSVKEPTPRTHEYPTSPSYTGLEPSGVRNIGLPTLLFAMVTAIAAASVIGGKIGSTAAKEASKTMVETEVFHEAINSWADFEKGSQEKISALEGRVAVLQDSLLAVQTANTELRTGLDAQTMLLDKLVKPKRSRVRVSKAK